MQWKYQKAIKAKRRKEKVNETFAAEIFSFQMFDLFYRSFSLVFDIYLFLIVFITI